MTAIIVSFFLSVLFLLLQPSIHGFGLTSSNFGSLQTRKFSRNSLSMEFNWKLTKKDIEGKMTKSVDGMQAQFNTLRAGAANPAILDRVFVDYFGTATPLSQIARVSASGAQQLSIEPFDKSAAKDIEKAIAMADLNLTPTNDGSGVIRINIPPLTEDRRKELVKQAKTISEDGKVSIRNVRRDFVEKIKAAEKAKEIGKDDSKGFQVRSYGHVIYFVLSLLNGFNILTIFLGRSAKSYG